MNKIETSTMSFYKMELEEIKELEVGDEIAICIKLNIPEKVEFVGARVTRPLFWNSDADEPGWELETNNGFVDPDSVWGVTTPYPVRSILSEENADTNDFYVTVLNSFAKELKEVFTSIDGMFECSDVEDIIDNFVKSKEAENTANIVRKENSKYLSSYITVTKEVTEHIEKHISQYGISGEICAWYANWDDFCSDWCNTCGYTKTEAQDLLNGDKGEFTKLPGSFGIVRFVV